MRFPHSLVLLKAGAYDRSGPGGSVVTDEAGFPLEVEQAPIFFKGWLQPSPTAKRIRDVANAEVLAADESGEAFTSHILFAPPTLPIQQRDRVRRDPGDGLYYEVAKDPEDAAGRRHHWEVDLTEFRYPGAEDEAPITTAPLLIGGDAGVVGGVLGGGVDIE